jgi:hypothetical protein
MQKSNGSGEGSLDAAKLNEQRTLDRSISTAGSKKAPDHVRLNIEMAIEWAHLGGD